MLKAIVELGVVVGVVLSLALWREGERGDIRRRRRHRSRRRRWS